MKSVTPVVIRLALVLSVLTAGLVAAAPAHADRDFSLRYTANEAGSIKGIANTNMTCSTAPGATGAATCVDARNAAVTDSVNSANDWRNNNAHTSAYIDVDSDASTFNSSTATQSLPAGSEVLFAALYWGGHYTGASSPADPSLRDQVKFKVPGSSAYETVTAGVLDDGVGGNAGRYQAFADVTGLVQSLPNSGNGTYAVADIQSAIGTDRYAGWSLIVAYRNTGETVKNLSIFDGLVSIGLGQSDEINISGFLTPPAGPLNAEIGFVTWEGDLGLNGDRAELNGHFLSDAEHPVNNFFNSRISHNGVLFTDRDPAYPNSLGMDAAWTTPPAGSITHNMTSATVKVNSVGEQYLPGVITFQVEIFSPKIEQTKTVTDENGGEVEPGDYLTYTISGKNNGQDGAADFVLNDPIPAGTSYVPGSIEIIKNTNSATGPQTDATGDDLAEFAADAVNARFGWEASPTHGGLVKPGYEYEISFRVKVDDDIAAETDIVNVATASYKAQTTGTPLETPSTAKVTTPPAPVGADLEIKKFSDSDEAIAGQNLNYFYKVTNHGPANVNGATVTDVLPAGLTYVDGAPGCAAVGQTVTCTINFLASGGFAQTGITVKVDAAYTDAFITNVGTVSSDLPDPDPDNNTSTLKTPVKKKADVQIIKTASPGNPKPGDVVTYTLKVKNNGPSVAKNVVATDSLPNGVTFVSADAPCVEADGEVTCALGTLQPGEEKILEIKVKVDPWGTVNPNYEHLVDVQKVETQIDLDPGETKTVEAKCPEGFFASDGSVRVDHIDQGTGDWDAPQVLKSAAKDLETWQGVVKNTATGRVQAKIFAVCIRKTTSPNAHEHKFKVSKPFTVTKTIKSGKAEATLKCGENQVAIQPGFDSTVPGHLRYSQPEGDGWKFKFDTDSDDGQVTFSIRCMNKQLKSHNGHTHDLKFERIWAEVVIGPNAVHEVQLTCPDGSKGIVGGWDLGKKLIPLGNDPRPVTRAFKVYNPTDKPQKARFSLLCLGDRTGGEVLAPKKIVNTAHVSSTTPDPDESNNSSTAKIKAEDGDADKPIDNGSGKPPVNNQTGNGKASGGNAKTKCRIVGNAVRFSKGKVAIRVRCNGKARGTARLTSIRKVKVGGKWFGRGTLLARGGYNFAAAGVKTITLNTTRPGRRIIATGNARRARLSIPGGTRVVRVIR